VLQLEHQLAEALARIAVLEQPIQGLVEEDGSPRPPGRWLKMKQAMKVTGYSRSGLLKLCQDGRVRFDFDGPHRLIDVTSVAPRKCTK
jgi:predicted DNA-binding transcriptional regulator AlpA